MHIQLLDTDKLIPYANNPRKNSAVDKVAASIKEFGFRQPIVVNPEMVVIVGHTRLQAAKKLGMTQVPTHIADNLSPKQIAAYRLADNRTNQDAEWDETLLALEFKELQGLFTGFDQSEIDTILAREDKYHKNQDDSPEPQKIAVCQAGEVYVLGKHKLICGDSTKVETYQQLLGDDKVDLVLTDPPYNVNYKVAHNSQRPSYTKHREIANDNLEQAAFDQFLIDVFKHTHDVMRAGACVYVFHADKQRHAFQQALLSNSIQLTVSLVWVKNSLVMSRMDYQPKHEPILYGWKEGGSHYFAGDRTLTTVIDDEPDYDKLTKEQLVSLLNNIKTDVIRHDKPSKADLHPTMKPVALVQELMENSSKPEQIVLDMFGGSGSTLIAAEKCNRQARMIELDPIYCDVIIKRYEDFTGNKAHKA